MNKLLVWLELQQFKTFFWDNCIVWYVIEVFIYHSVEKYLLND
jgi:hypothetical protein